MKDDIVTVGWSTLVTVAPVAGSEVSDAVYMVFVML